MKIGINLGYWSPPGPPPQAAESVAEADRLGLDSVWTAEAYGSDVFTPLAWWGARTSRIRLGTAIAQISAREPAAAAMAAITMDHLSQGRFILGLGVSGPQVVEGWYGKPFARPLARTREYIEIIRAILRRDAPVSFAGEQYRLPLEGGTGMGKALKSTVRPFREDLPIFLAAEGPKNVALAAEVCDGWLALFYAPGHDGFYRDALDEGFARDGARRSRDDFEVVASVPLILTDDVDGTLEALRPMYALYFGGMGSRDKNFHADVARRMGYEREVDEVQDLYLEGKRDEAAAAVPRALIEQLTLVGTREKILHGLEPWKASQVTTLLVQGTHPGMLEDLASLAA
ncbi:MAG: putative coenzyme F420-dependent oxidoreductase [Solirubrobacterales bacterium]|nr:putative coenzyme F420-dependent oxidoreductase [Solirubrobacterales bacterium]